MLYTITGFLDGLPTLLLWIHNLPLIGDTINDFWQKVSVDPQQQIGSYEPQIKKSLQHLFSTGTGMLGATLQFVLGIIISAFFMVSGNKFLSPIKVAITHLLGEKEGLGLLNASGEAIKGVSIGVMGTALIAAFVSWIGFTIAGVPFSLGLSALVFFLVVIQVGPLLVWIPVIIWQASIGETGWTIFLIVYTIGLMIIDGFLKPILIAKSGGKLPFLVLFIGVMGGMLAWGFTGMFKGAIVMAIFYKTITQWLEKRKMEQDNMIYIEDKPDNL